MIFSYVIYNSSKKVLMLIKTTYPTTNYLPTPFKF